MKADPEAWIIRVQKVFKIFFDFFEVKKHEDFFLLRQLGSSENAERLPIRICIYLILDSYKSLIKNKLPSVVGTKNDDKLTGGA